MSRNGNDSLIYTKYKTISVLPEEILEAYHNKMTLEKLEELYKQVKGMLLELSEEDAQKQIGDFSVLTSKKSKRSLEKFGIMLYNYIVIGKVHKIKLLKSCSL